MTQPRIAPAEPPYSASATDALARIMPPGVPPLALFRTLLANERVFLRVMASGLLDRGSISLREREILIDRTCARCGSEYEWGVHIAFFGAKAALSPEQVRGTRAADPRVTDFSPREQLLLRLADELHDTASVGDELYAALAAEWTAEQLVEMVVLVGLYHMISFATNAFRLTPEPFAARFSD